MMKAAEALGANIPQTIMAFAWGDGWTNQIQPFWALPLLELRDYRRVILWDIALFGQLFPALSSVELCNT